MPADTLAIDGGTPVRSRPFPREQKVGKEELKELIDVIYSGHMGRFGHDASKVAAFEKEFAEVYGVSHAIASTSGTSAIHIAVGMVNPSPGDEIIVGPITDMGSVVPVPYQTAIPIFPEVGRDTFNMDPASIEENVTENTVAIMAIHLFGNPCDMDAIMDIARRHDLVVIEDCSQAHMSEYRGKLVGTIGHIGCFSLQQSKHITAGEGGITVTEDEELAARGRLFMDKGWHRAQYGPRRYDVFGPNYRMNELTGAVALAQTRKLREIVALRRERGDLLTELIGDDPHVRPQRLLDGCEHTYWRYGMRVLEDAPFTPQEFAAALVAEGIPCSRGYIGRPIFLCHEAFRKQRLFGDSRFPFDHPNARDGIVYDESTCPVTQEVLDRMVLPIAPSQFLSEGDIREIAGAIRKVSSLLGR